MIFYKRIQAENNFLDEYLSFSEIENNKRYSKINGIHGMYRISDFSWYYSDENIKRIGKSELSLLDMLSDSE